MTRNALISLWGSCSDMDDEFETTDDNPEFFLAEILEMETIYKEIGEESLKIEFCKELATRFSCSPSRAGKPAIGWDQVHSWFLDKYQELQAKATLSPSALKLFVDLSDATAPSDITESSQKPRGSKVKDFSDLAFEAKSARDNAWYDVASFLTYRVLSTGELEVRVRFAGYGKEDDEWVNVRRAVRERSIPLEPSECHKVKLGDHMLCFQERLERALYFDAFVVEIQRQLHDVGDCNCIFVVRYTHDFSEERVPLARLCCRPPP